MSECKVCGDETTAEYRFRSHLTLCDGCHRETPAKVSRETFEKRFFGIEEVPPSTRREFYEDYKYSKCTLAQYIKEVRGS